MPRDAKGRFLPGPDGERHIFSKDECRKGYEIATRLAKMPSRTRAWLRNKIKGYYRGKPRKRRSA